MADKGTVEYWKNKFEELEAELAEERESSKLLEEELDKEITRLSRDLKNEKGHRQRAEDQFSHLKTLASSSEDHIKKLSEENATLKSKTTELLEKTRDLENSVDELESAKRQQDEVIDNLEERITNTIEKLGLAECELDEVRDENRNLIEELKDARTEIVQTDGGAGDRSDGGSRRDSTIDTRDSASSPLTAPEGDVAHELDDVDGKLPEEPNEDEAQLDATPPVDANENDGGEDSTRQGPGHQEIVPQHRESIGDEGRRKELLLYNLMMLRDLYKIQSRVAVLETRLPALHFAQ